MLYYMNPPEMLKAMFLHGIESVKPEVLIRKHLVVENGLLSVNGVKHDLNLGKCYLVGFGKAALGMAYSGESVLHSYLTDGAVIVPFGSEIKDCGRVKVFQGAKNNLPDEDSVNATSYIVKLVKNLGINDIVVCLISGGGSALFCQPKKGITMQQKIEITNILAASGASIKELNCIRKKLSEVKGGNFAQLIYPASVISYIMSDVVGDPLEYIASGPTVKNTNGLKSLDIVKKYGILNKIPSCVLKNLKDEFTVNEDCFKNVQNTLIGNNYLALSCMKDFAEKHKYRAEILTCELEGNVKHISNVYSKLIEALCQIRIGMYCGREHLMRVMSALNINSSRTDSVLQIAESMNDICLLIGGETSVTIHGNGQGGRNQELALRMAVNLDLLSRQNPWMKLFDVTFLSGGSDGIDGPTNAAGAIAYGAQILLAKSKGLDADLFISNNDSYNFYNSLGYPNDHLKIGHTGTNVMDFHIILIRNCSSSQGNDV